MQQKTFLRLLLFLPYLGWVAALFDLPSSFNVSADSIFTPILGLSQLSILYGIALWGVPYTVFLVGFWIWSKKRSTQSMLNKLMYSPLILALLVTIEVIIVFIVSAIIEFVFPSFEFLGWLLWLCILGSFFSIAYGYLFVGIGWAIYKISETLGIFSSEQDVKISL